MAEWATMHGAPRSPALRRSLIVLVGRSLAVGMLLVAWGLAGAVCPARAAPLAALALRDGGGIGVGGQHDGALSVASSAGPAGSRAPVVTGKAPLLAEVQRQGSVVAMFEDPTDPLIVIAVESGYITVRLRCGTLCPSIHLGDYVVVEGQRRSEAVVDAVDVWVAGP
jgi:hypothetical protein